MRSFLSWITYGSLSNFVLASVRRLILSAKLDDERQAKLDDERETTPASKTQGKKKTRVFSSKKF